MSSKKKSGEDGDPGSPTQQSSTVQESKKARRHRALSPPVRSAEEEVTDVGAGSPSEIIKNINVEGEIDEVATRMFQAIKAGMEIPSHKAKMSGSAKDVIIRFLMRVAEEWREKEGDGQRSDVGLDAVMASNKALLESNRSLSKIIDEQGKSCERLLNTVNDLTGRYREVIELSRGKEPGLLTAQKKASFAAVVTGKAGAGEGAAAVIKKLREAVKPEKTGIRLESMREGTGGRVIVKCADSRDLNKFTECLSKCKDLNVRKPEPLKAVLTILGIDEEECQGDLMQRVLAQNPELSVLVPDGGRLQDAVKVIRYERMGANARLRKAFVMVSARARECLNEMGCVYIGYRRARVVDETPLLQCYKCLGFGHTSGACKNEERCGYCAAGHRTSECKVKEDRAKHECFNCRKYLNVKSNHRASSYDCEFYKRTQRSVESRTVGKAY